MLEIENLYVAYDPAHPIIQNFNLQVGNGERVGITGPNGSGKSTLAKSVMGLVPRLSGDIRWQGRSLNGLRPDERNRCGIGFFFQNGRVFGNLSVEHNLRAAMIGRRSTNTRQALEEAGFATLPGLNLAKKNSVLAGNLSGGERHLLALLMVFLACPSMELLIADEPSAGVARKVQQELLIALQEIFSTKKIGILLIEQNIDFLNVLADRTVTLKV